MFVDVIASEPSVGTLRLIVVVSSNISASAKAIKSLVPAASFQLNVVEPVIPPLSTVTATAVPSDNVKLNVSPSA